MSGDWKEAAGAELRQKLQAETRLIETFDDQMRTLNASRQEAAKRIASYIDAAATLGIELAAPVRKDAPELPLTPATETPSPAVATSRTAREIVLDALEAAHPFPMKSSELRQTIENAMGRPIHYKTPGMTLYRLAEDGLVRREGHNWFFVPQQEEGPYDL